MPSRVLIVDDDRTTRVGVAELLEQAGYQTVAVGTFEDASLALKSEPFDLLITDVRLGAFNGLHLLVTSPKAIPAIVITGFQDPVLEAEARKAGADYLLKPVSPSTLLELVQRKLAPPAERFSTPRRWARKPVAGWLAAQVADEPARILDVSYGGLRFEVDRTPDSTFQLKLPMSQFSVQAQLVWKNLVGDRWMCGAAVSQDNPAAAREWFGLVDAIA